MNNPCFCWQKEVSNLVFKQECLTPSEQIELIYDTGQRSFHTWDECREYIENRVMNIAGEELVDEA